MNDQFKIVLALITWESRKSDHFEAVILETAQMSTKWASFNPTVVGAVKQLTCGKGVVQKYATPNSGGLFWTSSLCFFFKRQSMIQNVVYVWLVTPNCHVDHVDLFCKKITHPLDGFRSSHQEWTTQWFYKLLRGVVRGVVSPFEPNNNHGIIQQDSLDLVK